MARMSVISAAPTPFKPDYTSASNRTRRQKIQRVVTEYNFFVVVSKQKRPVLRQNDKNKVPTLYFVPAQVELLIKRFILNNPKYHSINNQKKVKLKSLICERACEWQPVNLRIDTDLVRNRN